MSDTIELSHPQLVESLGQKIRCLQSATRPHTDVYSSGCVDMDQCLPRGGYAAGSMVELVTSSAFPVGATSLALRLARQVAGAGKYIVLLDTPVPFYPPALERFGLPLERVIGLRPTTHSDLVWSIDQALRCSAVGCVIATMDRLADRTARRFQLATESGGGIGILIRSIAAARAEPSWADVQWHVMSDGTSDASDPSLPSSLEMSSARWFQLALKRCQGGQSGARIRIGLDASGEWITHKRVEVRDAKTSHVHLAAELAKPTRSRRDIAG